MKSLKNALPWLELAALLAAAVWALAFHLRLPGRLPDEESYRQVLTTLSREARPGDVVLLFPWWIERARLYAPAGLPVVGYQGSDDDPLTAHPRIWVLSQPRLPRAEVSRLLEAFSPGRVALGPARRFGNLELALYQNGRHRRTVFSAVESFEKAQVFLESPGGERTPCPFQAGAFRCPGPAYLTVAPQWHELGFAPRRCLWFHPPGGARRLIAEFGEVPAGAELALEGGLVWDRGFFHGEGRTPVHLGVERRSDGQPLLAMNLPLGTEGGRSVRRDWPQEGIAGGVRLWAQSDNPDLRELCVDVLSRGPLGGGTR